MSIHRQSGIKSISVEGKSVNFLSGSNITKNISSFILSFLFHSNQCSDKKPHLDKVLLHIKWLGGEGINKIKKERKNKRLFMTFSSTLSRSLCLYRTHQFLCLNFLKGFYTSIQLQEAITHNATVTFHSSEWEQHLLELTLSHSTREIE